MDCTCLQVSVNVGGSLWHLGCNVEPQSFASCQQSSLPFHLHYFQLQKPFLFHCTQSEDAPLSEPCWAASIFHSFSLCVRTTWRTLSWSKEGLCAQFGARCTSWRWALRSTTDSGIRDSILKIWKTVPQSKYFTSDNSTLYQIPVQRRSRSP